MRLAVLCFLCAMIWKMSWSLESQGNSMIADERSNIEKRKGHKGERPPCWFGRCRRRRSYASGPSKTESRLHDEEKSYDIDEEL
ncbi:hypothetical protein AWC38_SpisGene2316 [Stylophora pistillata]|uniref:Uncharacterized protein n=1 Tax=Stylophora pistillata TaxID=50429 RepID=A0A2B4SUM2_STYPI|nr:hypothetical protein AWC38_SpisGene2316 [Stylophora pistillata]